MSERMTDERAATLDASVMAAGWDGVRGHAAEIRADWKRARASEVEKDAVIKALADALWRNAPHWFSGVDGTRTFQSPEVTEALRLAGRL